MPTLAFHVYNHVGPRIKWSRGSIASLAVRPGRRPSRVAGWRASQGTIKEPDYVSTQLHYHPGRWDFPSPVGRAGTQRPPSRSSLARTQVSDQFAPAYRDGFCDHGAPASVCAGRVSPHHPCSQGPFAPAVCYCHHHCSYCPMRQSHVHQRISRLAVISPASRTGDLPCVASQALRPCRRPYTGELLRGIRPTLPRGFRLSPRRMGSALSCPATAFARESFSALQRFLYVAAWSLARPSGQPRLATARALSSELSSSGRPFSTSDSLHGCQAITTAGPPPAGLRCLQAALYA